MPSGQPASNLDAFLARVDRLRVEDLLGLATRPADAEAYQRARDEAAEVARFSGRSGKIRELEDEIERYVLAMFNRSTVQPGWFEANWGRPGSAADRAHLARSLADAATAILLEDRLSDEAAATLLGPWSALVGDDTEPGDRTPD